LVLIGIGLLFMVVGFIFYYLTCLFPILRIVFFDWFAIFFFILPWGITIYKLYKTGAYRQADTLPKGKLLVNYINREKEVIPYIGERAFPGQSVLHVSPVGLIENTGKDSVLTWGDKKTVFAIENCYRTPQPEMLLASQILWELGIRDSTTLKKLLLGKDLGYGDLELMGKVYLNMLSYDDTHGAKKLVEEMKEYKGEPVTFKPRAVTLPKKTFVSRHDQIAEFIDKKIRGMGK